MNTPCASASTPLSFRSRRSALRNLSLAVDVIHRHQYFARMVASGFTTPRSIARITSPPRERSFTAFAAQDDSTGQESGPTRESIVGGQEWPPHKSAIENSVTEPERFSGCKDPSLPCRERSLQRRHICRENTGSRQDAACSAPGCHKGNHPWRPWSVQPAVVGHSPAVRLRCCPVAQDHWD